MKRTLLLIMSIVLVLACVFSLIRIVPAVGDLKNIYEYKLADSDLAKEGIAQARDAIALLGENEQLYVDNVGTYVSGKAQLAAAGQQLAAGEKLLADNADAYNEGKELIGKMESLMPTIESLASSIQKVRDFNAGIIGGDADEYLGELRAGVMNTLANGEAIAALSEVVGMDIGSLLASNPTDTSVLGNVVNMYYDGLAQIKQYEDGKAQLADGKRQYAAGVQQLAEGDALLSTFEDGEGQLSAGLYQLLLSMSPSYRQKSFTQTVDSLPEYLAKTEEMKTDIPALYNGDGFDEAAYTELCDAIFDKLFQKDENGDYICTERDGKSLQLLNLDRCSLLLDKAEQYMADSEVDVTAEVVARVVCYALISIAAILGIVAGIMGIVSAVSGKGKCGKGFGISAAVLSIGAFVYAIISKFGDYIYGVRLDAAGAYSTAMEGTHIEYSGDTQHPVFIIILIATVLFAVIVVMAKKSLKKPESTVTAEAVSAAAGAEKSERMAALEAENAELKAMVAEMAAEAATVKE